MRVNIVSIFPGFFEGPLGLSIPARAAEAGLVDYRLVDLRDYTHDKHRTVDDIPYGGGAGRNQPEKRLGVRQVSGEKSLIIGAQRDGMLSLPKRLQE